MDHRFTADRRTLMLGLGAAALAPGFARAQVPQGFPPIPGLPPAAPEAVGCSAAGLSNINAVMADHIAKGNIQGAVTAFARKNRLVHLQAHGLFDVASNTPMPPDAIFVMMSSTKPVAGVAMLQQLEEGKVALEDPISKFIPELKTMRVVKAGTPRPPRGQTYTDDQLEPQRREITIRDLATHTSGLNGTAPRRVGDTLASYIPRLKDVPLAFQPGSRWGYSATTGPDVLARVVEITSGVPFDRYLKERIFEPCGMTDTAHNLTPQQAARVVRRYQRRNGAWAPAAGGNPGAQTTFFGGGAGLKSTARDYLLFETMLLNKGTIHGRRVLKPETVALMSSNLAGDLYRGLGGSEGGSGFGVLVRVVQDPSKVPGRTKGSFNWGGAYGTQSWTDPENELVAVLMIQQSVDAVQTDFEVAVAKALTA